MPAPTNAADIAALLERARTGDRQAMDDLFRECRGYLAVIAQAQIESWMRTKIDASDIIQQTLLEAHRGLDKFRGGTEAELLAWLRKILHRNTTDFVRHYKGTEKRQIRKEVRLQTSSRPDTDGPTEARAPEPRARTETPSVQLMRRERDRQLANALQKLTPDHRDVIMLRNLQRLAFDEVAERMGRTRPAVQMLWTRAIKKLQAIMDHDDD